MLRVVALLFLSALVLSQTPVENTCQHLNPSTGLTYDLLPMSRAALQVDYHLATVQDEAVETFFVNICANSKEGCLPASPVCEHEVPLTFPNTPKYVPWGSLAQASWLPYQPDPTADGITLSYTSDVPCGDGSGRVTSFINVLCDPAVLQGIIDVVSVSDDQCTATINMKSRYGCGFESNEPPACSDQVPEEPVACSEFANGKLECAAGNFQLQVASYHHILKYSFAPAGDAAEPAVATSEAAAAKALAGKTRHAASTTTDGKWRTTTTEESFERKRSGRRTTTSTSSSSSSTVEMTADWEKTSWTPGDDEDVWASGWYNLLFHRVFETDASGAKIGQVFFPELAWEFTVPQVVIHDDADCSQETTFNITNTNGRHWTKMVLVNHLAMASGVSSVKFDVLIEDYQWQSAASTHLVLEMSLYGADAITTSSSNATAAIVGDAYLTVNPVAQAYADPSNPMVSQTVDVAVAANAHSQSIVYSRFEGSLVHDPTIGFVQPAAPAPCVNSACEFSEFSLDAETTDGPAVTITRNGQWKARFAKLAEIDAEAVSRKAAVATAGAEVVLTGLEWTASPATSSVLPDGTSQVEMSLSTGASARWSSMEIQILSSMKGSVSHVDLVVRINDYEWASSNPKALLQLLIDVEGMGAISYTFDAVVVGDNYLKADSVAVATSTTAEQLTTVSMAYVDGALATVSHFEGSVALGMRMGVNSPSDSFVAKTQMVAVEGSVEPDQAPTEENNSNSSWWVWMLVAVGAAGLAAVVVAAGIMTRKRQAQQYESLA